MPNHHCGAVGEYRHQLLHWDSEPKKGVSQTDGGSSTGSCSSSFRSRGIGCHSSLVPRRPIKFHQSVPKCESKAVAGCPRSDCRCEYLGGSQGETIEVRPHVSKEVRPHESSLPMRAPSPFAGRIGRGSSTQRFESIKVRPHVSTEVLPHESPLPMRGVWPRPPPLPFISNFYYMLAWENRPARHSNPRQQCRSGSTAGSGFSMAAETSGVAIWHTALEVRKRHNGKTEFVSSECSISWIFLLCSRPVLLSHSDWSNAHTHSTKFSK